MKKLLFYLTFLLYATSIYAYKSIDIDLSNQRLYAKENGKIVFSGAISSGNSEHPTPRGVFRVIEKDRYHVSSKYPEPNGGAKMPYMHRLTKSGIAIHQGYLPGYPASHGCIRVSKSTAKKLWNWSHRGIKVRVYGHASNFRYAKKSKSYKKYAKRSSKKSYKKYRKKRSYKRYAKRAKYKRYSKRKYTKRRYAKKRYYKRKYHKRRAIRHYARDDSYEIIEIYDSW